MRQKRAKSYLLLGLRLSSQSFEYIDESMRELINLVSTAGGDVLGTLIQNRHTSDPVFYFGKGKIEEIRGMLDEFSEENPNVIVNADITASQVRNIEGILNCSVLTKTELILDIFALHASSKISRLQVELALLSYHLPRLVGQGISMSRTGGGIGTRGPGEKKLELDRRKIRTRISYLKKEVKRLSVSEKERTKKRQNLFKISVIGYTNAGKSSFISRLIRQNLYVKDQLFSTIDTTTRKLYLDDVPAVISDTVGFIKDIPHELIASFRSTLSETMQADLLLHLVDISSLFYEDHILVVESLIKDMDIGSSKLLIFNKMDLISEEKYLLVQKQYPHAFFISVQEDYGMILLLDDLRERSLRR